MRDFNDLNILDYLLYQLPTSNSQRKPFEELGERDRRAVPAPFTPISRTALLGSWELGIGSCLVSPSEQILQRQLHLPRCAGAADEAEIRVAQRAVRISPVRPVERIERLSPELDPLPVLDLE